MCCCCLAILNVSVGWQPFSFGLRTVVLFFYSQQRSGWLGRPFMVRKLRTMRIQLGAEQILWTQPGDQRITSVGQWLRRLRLDGATIA